MSKVSSQAAGVLRAAGFLLLAVPTMALGQVGWPRVVLSSVDPSGILRTISLNGERLDRSSLFFQTLGTNGRACATCHVASSGWTITPSEVRARFNASYGIDPLFRTVDGANTPRADVRTLSSRRLAYSMLLSRAVIRIGLPIPAGAEFELVDVDDPYGYASASELSLFRRPLPATNLRFLTGVMWDGRESSRATGTYPFKVGSSPEQNTRALFEDLKHQANDATVGHAQAASPLTEAQREVIALFELNLASAQWFDRRAGRLDLHGAQAGPLSVARQPFYITINDVFGGDLRTGRFNASAMSLFDGWRRSRIRQQAAIARGAALFNGRNFDIKGVAGLNDELELSAIRGTCTSCHDTPNIGNHSVALPVDIGVADGSRRTPDLPLYTLRNRDTGETRETTDPGLALITGRWKDIGKFKGPILRGLAARPPYFHSGFAADLGAVVEFYDDRFEIGFSDREKADLVAFLSAL